MEQSVSQNKSGKSKVIIGVVVGILILIGISTATANKQASPNAPEQTETKIEPTLIAKQFQYKVLSRVENKTVENIAVLIDSSETNHEGVAMDAKKTCKKPCNIDVYDDQKAYDLNAEYNKIMGDISGDPKAPQEWKKKNYVYVADHLVGSVDFETGTFSAFPFKDWYYKELKGEK